MRPRGLRSRARRVAADGRFRVAAACHDRVHRIRHGEHAPRWHERIWVDPARCRTALSEGLGQVWGAVRGGDWDLRTQPIEQVDHVRFCLAHWRDGVPWEETGAYEAMLADIEEAGGLYHGCRTIDDVVRRYERLDRTYQRFRDEGRMLTRSQVVGRQIREQAGIHMHVGREGQPIFQGNGGCHRLAAALCAGLPTIPAVVGTVHLDAPPSWRTTYRAGS